MLIEISDKKYPISEVKIEVEILEILYLLYQTSDQKFLWTPNTYGYVPIARKKENSMCTHVAHMLN